MRKLSLPLALAALALLAPAASARDQAVTSFDGTQISTSFFPAAGLKAGQKAPTVLMTHGWAGTRTTDENGGSGGVGRQHRRRRRCARPASTSSPGTRAGSAPRAAS